VTYFKHVISRLTRLEKIHQKIRPCHTAAILSRETKKALFYHAEPRSQNRGGRLCVVKQSFFGLQGQYGPRVTKANSSASKGFFVVAVLVKRWKITKKDI